MESTEVAVLWLHVEAIWFLWLTRNAAAGNENREGRRGAAKPPWHLPRVSDFVWQLGPGRWQARGGCRVSGGQVAQKADTRARPSGDQNRCSGLPGLTHRPCTCHRLCWSWVTAELSCLCPYLHPLALWWGAGQLLAVPWIKSRGTGYCLQHQDRHCCVQVTAVAAHSQYRCFWILNREKGFSLLSVLPRESTLLKKINRRTNGTLVECLFASLIFFLIVKI